VRPIKKSPRCSPSPPTQSNIISVKRSGSYINTSLRLCWKAGFTIFTLSIVNNCKVARDSSMSHVIAIYEVQKRTSAQHGTSIRIKAERTQKDVGRSNDH